MRLSQEEIVTAIRTAAERSAPGQLTYSTFHTLSGITMSQVFRHFDSWSQACSEAGVTCGSSGPENIKPNFSKGKAHALAQLKRVAAILKTTSLSKAQFDKQSPEVKAGTVARLMGGWDNALKVAGLSRSPNFREVIPLSVLAENLLRATMELSRVPTINQLMRRSHYSKNSFTRKFGTYKEFKRCAIRELLENHRGLDEPTCKLLSDHLNELESALQQPRVPVNPHHRGRLLGFRAFAFAPTYEAEVASLFSSVADELGFEIIAQRPAFPDCEARRLSNRRRKRYEKCMIEYELKSSDYVRHKHPLDGCDLIVCWEHDWEGCPISVLELRSAIRELPGWK